MCFKTEFPVFNHKHDRSGRYITVSISQLGYDLDIFIEYWLHSLTWSKVMKMIEEKEKELLRIKSCYLQLHQLSFLKVPVKS